MGGVDKSSKPSKSVGYGDTAFKDFFMGRKVIKFDFAVNRNSTKIRKTKCIGCRLIAY